jgi:predicted DNA-binding transcriptional regulator YafY
MSQAKGTPLAKPVSLNYRNAEGVVTPMTVLPHGIWFGVAPENANIMPNMEEWMLSAYDLVADKWQNLALARISNWTQG